MRCLEVQHGQNPVDYTYLLFKKKEFLLCSSSLMKNFMSVKQSNAEAARHTHMI